jgi:hypothetical protein
MTAQANLDVARKLVRKFCDGTKLGVDEFAFGVTQGFFIDGRNGLMLTDKGRALIGIETPLGDLEPKSSALDVQQGGSHYKTFKIQPVEFIEANKIPFLEACVIKRMCRHESKAKAEDLLKAKHEIDLILELRYGIKP